MGESLLRNYCIEAAELDAILVFNGLVNGRFKDFGELIHNISSGLEVGIILDNTLFEQYKVSTVPAFVIEDTTSKKFDKIEGNIGIRSAIEIFQDKGRVNWKEK